MTPSTFNRLGIVEGSTEIVSLGEAKAQLLVTNTHQDEYIKSLISAAREAVEDYCKRSLIASTWRVGYSLESLVCGYVWSASKQPVFELCRGPVASIASVKYFNSSNVESTINSSNYVVDLDEPRGAFRFIGSFSFPSISKDYPNPLKVVFQTGAENSPVYKHAIKMLIQLYFDNRSPVVEGQMMEIPLTVKSILGNKKVLNSL